VVFIRNLSRLAIHGSQDGFFEHPGHGNKVALHQPHLAPASKQVQSFATGQINFASTSISKEGG